MDAVHYRLVPGHRAYRVGSDGSVWSRKIRHMCVPKGTSYALGSTWHKMRPMCGRGGAPRLKIDGINVAVAELLAWAFGTPPPSHRPGRPRMRREAAPAAPRADLPDLRDQVRDMDPGMIYEIRREFRAGRMSVFALSHVYRIEPPIMYFILHPNGDE